MPRKPKASPSSDLESVRARLKEAEDTLAAIRSGKVDALIVDGSDGTRVFTLQGADHRYRRLVEEMREGAVIVGADGFIRYANSAFASLLGVPLEQVIGTVLSGHAPRAARPTFESILKNARTETVTFESELAVGGKAVPVHVSAGSDGSEGQGDVSIVVTNLTEAMRGADQRFEFLTDMLPQIIWAARPDGSHHYFNRRWFEFSGMTLEDSTGTGWHGAVHPADLPHANEAWSHAVEMGSPYEATFRIRRAVDGEYHWHLGRATPQKATDGTILRWYGTFTDIEDERAFSANAERAREKAEEATRLKDEFLATLSHELRTPLNAILGWGRLLQNGSLAPAQRERAVDTIVRNATSQNQLIDDLLDVSRIISGKFRLDIAPVRFHLVIEAALDVVRPSANAKGVRLDAVIDVDAGLVAGDSDRLQQVLWNLLANAVKFTPKGGRILVTLFREDSSVVVSVSDDGCGMASDFLPHVFDRFRQQDGAITRRAGGLGLGLALVKSIVELHGGTASAHSDGEGMGASFFVRLPLMPVKREEAPPPPQSVEPLADYERPLLDGLKVLVIDDEADARELLRITIEECSASVTTAGSVGQALDAVATVKPHIIVSDIGMPVEDGYSFVRRLRRLPKEEGGRTPAIALTAYARPEDRTRALLAGFHSHLSKPIDPHELVLVIASLAERYAG